MRLVPLLLAGSLVATASCSPALRLRPPFPDAPFEMRDDADRDQAIDALWVMAPGPARDASRARIADALARRLGDALDEDHPFTAQRLLFELVALWRGDPAAVATGLARHVGLLQRVRATFARSGASVPTLAALVVLAEVDPTHRAAHLAELDEVLHFADDLEAAKDGPAATRARPIALLQPTVLALPLPWLVDRYVTLLEDRQHAVVALIERHGASIELVRAHHDILETAHRIAIALARAGRIDEIAVHLARLQGKLGSDRALTTFADAVAHQPTPAAYLELAHGLRADDHAPDPAAALAVELAGVARHPRDASLLAAAGDDAAALGRVDQPIALYERAVAVTPADDLDPVIALRLGRLYARRIARLADGGRPGAAIDAWHSVARYAEHAPGSALVWHQVAALGETALGRGLLGQGELAAAKHALLASLDRARSVDAYETLATIDYKTDRLGDAAHYAAAGLALLGDTAGDRYRRARLERLAGDVTRRAGQPHRAARLYLDAMRTWVSLGPDHVLPPPIAAERALEEAHILAALGDRDKAAELVLDAVDTTPDVPAIYAGAVRFLLELDRPNDALDALHRGLDTDLPELYKIHACLWAAGDARRRGTAVDGEVASYLAGRRGELWYERLAQAASGRFALSALRDAATTAPRRAELAFYGATLGLDPRAATPAGVRALLEQVVRARLVTDAEYDLARRYLAAR